jgi:hypothetical protein
MKKIAFLVVVLMLVASAAFAQKITQANLADLKGNWMGVANFDAYGNATCEMVVENTAVPVTAALTISMVPDFLAQQLGMTSGTHTFKNDSGRLTSQGSLMFAGDKNFIEFYSLKGNRLDGWFYFNGVKGDVVLKKK